MNYKVVLKEILIWVLSAIIVGLVWYPIYSQIPYKFLFLGLLSTMLLIQLGRWFVFYDNVLFFKNKYGKLLSLPILFLSAFIIHTEGQKIALIIENMDVYDLVAKGKDFKALSMQASYQLFYYLKNLLILTNFCTPGLAIVLILKIIYKTIGMGNEKVRKYLAK